MILLALAASIGWADHRGFHCPENGTQCIDPAQLTDLPPGIQSALHGAGCSVLDRPGGIICDTAIATAVMASCPASAQWWIRPPCWNSVWLRALAPNLEHGLDALIRANPRGK